MQPKHSSQTFEFVNPLTVCPSPTQGTGLTNLITPPQHVKGAGHKQRLRQRKKESEWQTGAHGARAETSSALR